METFEGENFCEFRGFGAISESFVRENQRAHPLIINGS